MQACAAGYVVTYITIPKLQLISYPFQSKMLRSITKAPWFVSNQTLHADLGILFINGLLLCVMCVTCLFCPIVVLLPPGENPFAVKNK
jgi:hypothetical protein